MIVLRLLIEVPLAIACTLLAVRLLGVRRSWVATTVAGVVGWTAANLLRVGLDGWRWRSAALAFDTLVFAVVFTMLAAVVLDLVARPGSLAHGQSAGLFVVPRPFRDARRHLEPYARYREIISIARRNGLSGRGRRLAKGVTSVNGANGSGRLPTPVAVRKTLEEAGVVFIKLGQMASTRDDIVPAEYRAELAKLQSDVDPAPPEAMREQLETELGGPVERFFAEFDWKPIGSASIAHAYGARLVTGEPVVVKVQRPGSEELVDRDTKALLHLANLVERRTPQGQDLHVSEMADEFARALRRELDFPREAAAAIDLAAHTDADSGVRIPRIYADLVTQRVLVEQRFNGVSVAHHERIAELSLDEAELADRFVRTMLDHMLTNGHFHADPHPGNVLLLDDGTLGLIDFGATGRLDPAQRSALIEIAIAAMHGDTAALRDGIEQIAMVGGDLPDAALERALGHFLSEHIAATGTVDSTALTDLMPLLATFDIRLPPELVTCFRAIVLTDGTARSILPGYALVDGMRRMLDGAVKSPAPATMQDQVVAELVSELPRLRRLPAHVDRLATLAERGQLRARISLFSTPDDARVVMTLVNRLVLGVVGGFLAVAAAVLLSIDAGGATAGGTSLTRVFGFVALGVAALLVLRVVAAVVRDGSS